MSYFFKPWAIWWQVIRPKTLPLALATMLCGASLAIETNTFRPFIFVLSLLTAFCLQALSNLANDVGDSLHHIDHAGRQGPLRVLQQGLLSAKALQRGMVGLGILTLALEVFLLWEAFGLGDGRARVYFFSFLALGLFALWAAIAYAYGKRPYGHRSGGDFSVAFFFGLVGVQGSSFLYTQTFLMAGWPLALGFGAWSVAILNLNNIRDMDADKQAGKHTLSLMLGLRAAWRYQCILLAFGAIAWLCYALFFVSIGWGWLFVAGLPLLVFFARKQATNAQALTQRLRQLVLFCLLEAVLLTLGSALS